MKRLLALLALCLCATVQARDVIPLNEGWKFRYGHAFEKDNWKSVTLPHTWNTADAESAHPYTRTLGIYKMNLKTRPEWKGKRVFLRLKGAGVIADVQFNNVWLGQHRGAYTAFCYELTPHLPPTGKSAELRIRVSNAETSDIIPLTGDFNIFGGLYRGVELIVADPVCVSPLDNGSSGVRIRQESLTDAEAKLTVGVALANPTGQPQTVTVEVAGQTFTAQGTDAARVPVTIANPHRWNGVADPFLYTLTVRVGEDSVTETFGVREIRVDPNQGLFLNGKHLQLRGVCRHQEWEGKLSALTEADHLRDVEIMRDMGANAVRLAHYPQAEEMYDACDRVGLLVWAEIPFVGPGGYDDEGYIPSDRLHENARQQLVEMIRQHQNHPSIIVWGLFNELRMAPNPVPFLKELNALAKAEDPTRPTVGASNLGNDAGLTFVTDLIAWNRYDGWYGGMPKNLGNFLDQTHKKHPKLCIAISEYGAGASIDHHEEKILKPNAPGKFHPEAWQTEYHILNWTELDKRPYLWGTFIWNLFDFAASHRTEGDRNGINDKGLVTHDRKTFKDAYYFYKANWRDDVPVLHLCEKRFTQRKADKIFVRAFSNVGPAELLVNGQSCGIAQPDAHRVLTWRDVPLRPGDNAVTLRTPDGKTTDSCVWKR